jgi:hypothetical protein
VRNAAIIAAYIKIHKTMPTIADRRELLQISAPEGLPVTVRYRGQIGTMLART